MNEPGSARMGEGLPPSRAEAPFGNELIGHALAERDLRIAKLALLARRTSFDALATALNALLLCLLLYRSAPLPSLAVWAASQLLGAAWVYQRVNRKRRPPLGSQRGVRRAVGFCALAGLSLGSSVTLLHGASDFTRFLVLITLGSMASSASTTLAAVPLAAQAYIAGSLGLPAIFWLFQGQHEYVVLAGLSLSMTFFLVRNARVSHEAFLEGLGRAQQIELLSQRFRAEQAEWLDLSQATDAFALLDTESRLLLWNARFEQMITPARAERGAAYSSLLTQRSRKPSTVDGRAVSEAEWLAIRRGLTLAGGEVLEGYPTESFYRVSSQRLASGRQVVLAVDVSALKRAERALHEGELLLSHTQRQESVGVMAGGVAHDFNNLLTTVGGAADLLSTEVASDTGRRLLDDIGASVERGARLTRQLLAYGRRQALNPRALDLNLVLTHGLPLFRRLLPATVRLDTALCADLWPVYADPEQLEQVVINLVLNARDAMPTGGRLLLQTRNADPDSIELCVEDNGIGMSAATSARIFEPFFSTKDQHRGSGLGLSAVHGIVRQSGGSISVESRLGEGTRLQIRLPRGSTPSVAPPAAVPVPALPRAEMVVVLVVDDEETVLEVTGRLLRRLGHEVIEASRPDVALRILEAGGISLLITDVVMPEMNGAELCAAARRLHPQLPVLFMSGYDPGLLAPFEAHDVLHKPFTSERLARAVAAALTHGRGAADAQGLARG